MGGADVAVVVVGTTGASELVEVVVSDASELVVEVVDTGTG